MFNNIRLLEGMYFISDLLNSRFRQSYTNITFTWKTTIYLGSLTKREREKEKKRKIRQRDRNY